GVPPVRVRRPPLRSLAGRYPRPSADPGPAVHTRYSQPTASPPRRRRPAPRARRVRPESSATARPRPSHPSRDRAQRWSTSTEPYRSDLDGPPHSVDLARLAVTGDGRHHAAAAPSRVPPAVSRAARLAVRQHDHLRRRSVP